jgi:hypothetical protein
MLKGKKEMNVNYDPAVEWDKHCDYLEKAEQRYIAENQAKQENELDEWMPKLISFWNRNRFYKQSSWNERVLLCIWICNHYNGNLTAKLRADEIYEILDQFPYMVDAIDDMFSEDLHLAVLQLKNWLEEQP